MLKKIISCILSIIFILPFLILPLRHVHAQSPTPAQIELACPAGSNPISPTGTVIDQSQPVANQRQWLCVDFFGNVIVNGAITFSCRQSGMLFVPGAAGCWSGSDIGAQINSAYSSCPTNGTCHIILTNTTPQNFSTPINFTTSGKFILLEQLFPCVANATVYLGGCLNFTPTSGSAFTLDYVPTGSQVSSSPHHGFKGLGLVNASCLTTGGCASSAFGIVIGNTNWGASGAVFERVSLFGFGFAFDNSNTVNVPSVTWVAPLFEFNGIPFVNGTNTNNIFLGGFFQANGAGIQATATVGGEYSFDQTVFSQNGGPLFDFTRNTTKTFVTCTACHFEDSASISTINANYISGLTDMRIYGGIMETDQGSGTQNWFASISAGGALEIHGLELSSAGKSFTQAFLLNTTARGNIQVTNVSPTQIPTLIGGAGAPLSTSVSISANSVSLSQIPVLKLTDQGTVTLVAGTSGAVTFPSARTYTSAPQCVVTWNGTGTLTGIIKCVTSTTQLTVTSSVGTDTAVMNYTIFGQ